MTPQKQQQSARSRSFRARRNPPGGHRVAHPQAPQEIIPSPTGELLRIIPLGGLGEVGRNMMVVEWQNSILLVDMGFRMPEEDMPGIDYIIPNVSYLKGKEKQILGLLITHGHYDHIGAIPYYVGKLGNPPIYAGNIAKGIILKRQEDFPDQPRLKLQLIEHKKAFRLGPFEIEPFRQNHNIPDNFGFVIKTPIGNIVHTSDFKFDDTPVFDKPTDYENLKRIGKEKVLLLMSDSTNAEEENHSMSEKVIMDNLEEIFKHTKGRILTATFASLLNRIQQIIALSEKYGRRVVLEGHSMRTNVEIARQLGYIKAKPGTFIKAQDAGNYHDSKITVMGTGAQGEERAVLMRIVNGEHRNLKIQKGDTVIFSSSVIPGNERTVQYVKDQLYRQGAEVFHYKMLDIHASGHANRDELRELLSMIKPKFLLPIHGQISMLVNHARLAKEEGMPEKNIVVAENGNIVNITKTSALLDKRTVPSNYIMVDGLGVGDIGEVVLRDRQNLAKDGMFVIITVVDRQTGKVKGSPDIISRGFIYLRESQDMLRDVRKRTIRIVEESSGKGGAVNWVYVRDNVRNKIGDLLFEKTERHPMVLPVIIEV